MTDAELRALSAEIEALTGFDSIATVESHYPRAENGSILCAFSDENTGGQQRCTYRRRDPIVMWRHVHFTGHPPPSLRVARPEDVDIAALREHVS